MHLNFYRESQFGVEALVTIWWEGTSTTSIATGTVLKKWRYNWDRSDRCTCYL